MTRVLLLHTNREYADTLSESIEAHAPGFRAVPVSRVALWKRLGSLTLDNYDIVQVDELLVNGLLASLSKPVRNVPLVTAIRGWADYTNAHGEYGWLRRSTIEWRTRAVLRQTDATIFLSRKTRDEFTRHFQAPDPTVVGRPIDLDRYSGGTDLGRDTFDVLTVTNLRYEAKYRGVLTVLRAMEPLFEHETNLRLRVAGGGRYLAELKSFLVEYPHSEKVEVLGYVDEIEDEFASADAFVYVSYLDAYPTVVLEAQAAGLPVVAADTSGVPDAVNGGGVVVPSTPQSIREELTRVVSDDSYRSQLEARSRERMATYNRDAARGHAAVWRRVLEGA